MLRNNEKETKMVEIQDKKEHEPGNSNHFMALVTGELSTLNEKLEITKNQIKARKKLENKLGLSCTKLRRS